MRKGLLVKLVACLLLGVISTPAFAIPPGVSVLISPTSFTITMGADKRLTVQVSGTSNTAVVWSVNGILGGNSSIGLIDSTGKYIAPKVAPPGGKVTIKVTSVADTTVSATCIVTIGTPSPVIPTPSISSIVPTQVILGPIMLTVNGSKFVSGAQVLWNGSPLATQFVSSAQLTASGNANQVGNAIITVMNQGNATASSAVTVKVVSGLAVSVVPGSVGVLVSGTQQFQAAVSNTPNQAVTWKVNSVVGGDPAYGTIDTNGLFTAPAAIPQTGMATITAVSQVDNITQGSASVTFVDPQSITYGRFLEQSTFGPTPQLMAHIHQTGIQGFLDEQFQLPESPLPAASTATNSGNVDAFFNNALIGQDQLRQRTIFAMSEIFVETSDKNYNADMLAPWLQLLSRNAFGNYHTLLKELTLDASMGHFLDSANNVKMGTGGANENYAREVMQLFSVGLYQLNPDGSLKLDASNQPIPTYDINDVRQMALALTGWTYGNPTNTPPKQQNPNYYPGPMLPLPAANHVTSAKTILGTTIPAGQTAQQDLDSAINILYNHPNVAPFMATRLIRALVTSNPSPAYISRISAVFNDNGMGVRGDLKAVIQAILLDQDARNDQPPANFGRLRTPVQQTIAVARAFGINLGSPSVFAYSYYSMNEPILNANSVFGHYSPLYHIPKTPLFGPEFQIYTASEAVNRANFFYGIIYNPYPINPALQPLVPLAKNPVTLVNAVDQTLLFGRMSPTMRTAILNALPPMPDDNQRVLTVVYLTIVSGDYLVQH